MFKLMNLDFSNITKKGVLALFFRLSIVVGVGAGVYDMYRVQRLWAAEQGAIQKRSRMMECALKIPTEWFDANRNEYGLFDLKKHDWCRHFHTSETFFTNEKELTQFQFQKDAFFGHYNQKIFDFDSLWQIVLTYFITTNVVGFISVGTFICFRWLFFFVFFGSVR